MRASRKKLTAMPANEQRPAELYESLRTLHTGRPNDLKNSGNAERNPCHIDYLHTKNKKCACPRLPWSSTRSKRSRSHPAAGTRTGYQKQHLLSSGGASANGISIPRGQDRSTLPFTNVFTCSSMVKASNYAGAGNVKKRYTKQIPFVAALPATLALFGGCGIRSHQTPPTNQHQMQRQRPQERRQQQRRQLY